MKKSQFLALSTFIGLYSPLLTFIHLYLALFSSIGLILPGS